MGFHVVKRDHCPLWKKCCLYLGAVALSLAFKMRFWNIGGEGQFILGSIAAATVAFKAGPVLPEAVTLVLMCVAAMLVAGLYGAFVAALKVKFGTNETLMTLMLNYIALYVLIFIGETKADWNFFLDPESVLCLPALPRSRHSPRFLWAKSLV